MSLKNPVTPAGMDPGTVRLVAQRLNHYATPGLLIERQYCNLSERTPNKTHEERAKGEMKEALCTLQERRLENLKDAYSFKIPICVCGQKNDQ
jgi:hypothetical protein